jgi:hypothetical protein
MFLAKMINFCKSENCPTSQDLLAFQETRVSPQQADEISKHVEKCEFCGSELEFYQNYPQADDPVITEKIPSPLYELAEALLNNKHKDKSILNKLMGKNEGLTLRNV